MKNALIVGHKQRIDDAFKKANSLGGDPEILAHWARYLCVLVAGFVEVSIQEIMLEFTRPRSSPEIAQYVSRRIKAFQNAKTGKIFSLLDDFDTKRSKDVAARVDDVMVAAVNSVVSVRHEIAHGRPTGISMSVMKIYYPQIVKFVDACEQSFA